MKRKRRKDILNMNKWRAKLILFIVAAAFSRRRYAGHLTAALPQESDRDLMPLEYKS